MGLDMYLTAKKYLSDYNDKDKELADVIKAEQIKGMGDMKPKYIICQAMYWRKANHIHKWFVDNVQDGEDKCQTHYVSHEKLVELCNLCIKVLADRSLAPELLPVADGFFFGGGTYEDWYFSDLQVTVQAIEELLAVDGIDEWEFEYRSSW
jgi:hypothetical protein